MERDVDLRLCQAFFCFVQQFDERTCEFQHDWDALSDYIAVWIEFGDAIVVSEGDWGTFMSGLAQIVAAYHEDPTRLDYQSSRCPRRRVIEKIFALSSNPTPHAMWTWFMVRESWDEAVADLRVRRKLC